MPPAIIAVIVIVVLIAFMILLTVAVRYKTCPPDKILIIYGKISPNPDGTYRSAKCVHGGASFVMPFFQKYTFMDFCDALLPEVHLHGFDAACDLRGSQKRAQ